MIWPRSVLPTTESLARLLYGDERILRRLAVFTRRRIDVDHIARLLESPVPHEYIPSLDELSKPAIPADLCEIHIDACRASLVVVAASVLTATIVFTKVAGGNIPEAVERRLRSDLWLVTNHDIIEELVERVKRRIDAVMKILSPRIGQRYSERLTMERMPVESYANMLRRYWDTPVTALMVARKAVVRALLASRLYDYLALHYTRPRLWLDETLVFVDEESLVSRLLYGQRGGDTLLAEIMNARDPERVAEERLRGLMQEWLAANKYDLEGVDDEKLERLVDEFIRIASKSIATAFTV